MIKRRKKLDFMEIISFLTGSAPFTYENNHLKILPKFFRIHKQTQESWRSLEAGNKHQQHLHANQLFEKETNPIYNIYAQISTCAYTYSGKQKKSMKKYDDYRKMFKNTQRFENRLYEFIACKN